MQSIRQVQRRNDLELEKVIPPNASWHTDYRDTAYINIRGLPFELSEGDIMIICSQYGNPTDVKLARDKDTGKSRGFAWLKFEDQRSCDLAVDNLSGAGVMGRVLSVDHARYTMKEGERETVGEDEIGDGESGDDTDREGERRRKRRRSSGSGSESEEERPMMKEELELAKLLKDGDEEDPMKKYLIEEKRAEVAEALKSAEKNSKGSEGRKHRHHHHRSRRDAERNGDSKSRRSGHKSRRDGDSDGEGRHRSHRRKRERSVSSGNASEERDTSKQKSRGDASDENHERNRRKRRDSSSEDSERNERRRSKR